jgi:hypothetical protein
MECKWKYQEVLTQKYNLNRWYKYNPKHTAMLKVTIHGCVGPHSIGSENLVANKNRKA